MQILLLVVLAFIAFMLWRIFNQNNNSSETMRKGKLDVLMPHLAQTTNQELKDDINNFILNGPKDIKSKIESRIENEPNGENKVRLEAKLKRLGEETQIAKRFLEDTQATDEEKLYLLNSWYEGQTKNFFDLDHEIYENSFDDFLLLGGYRKALQK